MGRVVSTGTGMRSDGCHRMLECLESGARERVDLTSAGRGVRAKFRGAVVYLGLFASGACCMHAASKQRVHPELGAKVLVFDPSMRAEAIQAEIDKVYAVEQHSEFGKERY